MMFVELELWRMEEIQNEKQKGNEYYKKYLKTKEKEDLLNSSRSYGKAIELILQLESSSSSSSLSSLSLNILDGLITLKPTLFLNLSIINNSFQDYYESKRCCNAAIVCCNNINLLLIDLGINEDMTSYILVNKPIIPMFKLLIAKILYWRSKALLLLNEIENAWNDIQESLSLQSKDKNIISQYKLIQTKTQLQIQPQLSPNPQTKPIILTDFIFSNLTVNGGYCCQRKGYWSQSVSEAIVYLPFDFLEELIQNTNIVSNNSFNSLQKSELKISFTSKSIIISYLKLNPIEILFISLLHQIAPLESIWCVEDHFQIKYLVLYLTKLLSNLKSIEDSINQTEPNLQRPGDEWWEAIDMEDERIDPLFCSIGSNISELPQHARERAEREHRRFQNLSKNEQEKEKQYLIDVKQSVENSMNRVEKSIMEEEITMQQIPERGNLLRQLREEFPNIEFISK